MRVLARAAEENDLRSNPLGPGQALDREDLYRRHVDFVQRVAASLAGPDLEVDDLVQDVFVQAIRGWASFKAESSIETWLYGVVIGVVRNARRRVRFRRFLGLEHASETPSGAPGPIEISEKNDAGRQLIALLERLPERERTVVVLFELEELPGKAIAELLGCSVQVVWNLLFKGRRRLALELERSESEVESAWRRT